ncbi:MAG: LptF/LptG family permease [Planctomycetaceae bacterium]|nr:LptF/LptG family permease [Planctomycetaceae bacterium]
MWIIDRYLLRQFVQVFFICWFSLTGLFVVFHAFGNLDEFIRYCEARDLPLLPVMGEYYAYRTVAFFDQMSAILTMIAAMFTITWIQRHNELTALMAAGLSRRRIVKPVIIAAVLISLGALASRETVIPRCRLELERDIRDLGGEAPKPLRTQYDNETGVLFRGQQTIAAEKRIHNPNFLLPSSIDPLGRSITAPDCYYRAATADRPGGYLFENITTPLELLQNSSLKLGERPVVLTPRDYPDWLKPNELFVVSGFEFSHLAGSPTWRQFSSTGELIVGIRNPAIHFPDNVRVAIHARMVQPLLDVTLLFLGLPLVLTRENRNMFMAIGLSVVLVGGFMLVQLTGQYLGSSGLLSPALGAWLPAMVFVPLAVYLYDRVER